ncbi:anaerobic ribonucleoside-triphosphate reductase activating protein [Thermosipho ferrireducens]|uniref:Anaerobic ribonucleoside-triphosphate reductase activating protein n=1 Tax=Thermosipho ferrireducens TaxID=2571116 RepID=A0ABX7S7T4_9BACT|nr:anaerobic ribonucleoside-triphosphate reductase activating protein [Thermosipho ferrireducens]QTA38279.1 anaerobic ribonucleoside-triphosphate reductase activating protein [Thermosipho ferrireducens]
MILAGIRTFSFVDYPRRISSVVYTGGCNFRCQWCHNWKIAYANEYKVISEDEMLDRLKFLRARISAVCITGGEPTIHNDLIEFVKQVKDMEYMIKIDTNGTNPDMIYKLIEQNLIDYVAVDIKAKPENYSRLVNVYGRYWESISETIKILRTSNIEYEFRMTYVPGLSSQDDIDFFEEFLVEGERAYITVANSTEIFKIKSRRSKRMKIKRLIFR